MVSMLSVTSKEVGSSSGTGYETFTNILNLAGQVAPTMVPT